MSLSFVDIALSPHFSLEEKCGLFLIFAMIFAARQRNSQFMRTVIISMFTVTGVNIPRVHQANACVCRTVITLRILVKRNGITNL